MKVEFIREQPATPPLKEIVIRLTVPEAKLLKRIFICPNAVSNTVITRPDLTRGDLQELLAQIRNEFERQGAL